MSGSNGLVQPDPGLLSPGDLRRARVMLGGQSPHELMQEFESMLQLMAWCIHSRTDPAYTWEQAGTDPLNLTFDMAGEDAEPDPPKGEAPGSNGPAPATKRESSSRTRRASSAPAPSSAASSASPAPSTTP
jgi:hypothetical protein